MAKQLNPSLKFHRIWSLYKMILLIDMMRTSTHTVEWTSKNSLVNFEETFSFSSNFWVINYMSFSLFQQSNDFYKKMFEIPIQEKCYSSFSFRKKKQFYCFCALTIHPKLHYSV